MFVLPQYNFFSIIASIVTASYCECCNIRTDTNFTASGTVTCLSCVPLLSVIANKTTLRLSDHCPDVSVCHVNSSYTIHCTPHCSSHVSPNKMHDCSYFWLLPSQLLSVFWCKWLHWMKYEVSFGTDIAHKQPSFEISSVSCLENLGKYFSIQVAPQGDVSSVQVLQYFF